MFVLGALLLGAVFITLKGMEYSLVVTSVGSPVWFVSMGMSDALAAP